MEVKPFLYVFLAFLCQYLTCQGANAATHPLDPLTAVEIEKAVAAIYREKPGIDWAFHYITLEEPPKDELLNYFLSTEENIRNAHIPRKAFCIVRDVSSPTPNRVVVNLSGTGHVETWNKDPGQFAQMTENERLEAAGIALSDPTVIKRCAQMGYSNMSLVTGSGWPIGDVQDEPEFQGRRIFKVSPSGSNFEGDNNSPHPMDFQVLVDLVKKKVIEIEELPAQSSISDNGTNKTGVHTPKTEYNYKPELLGADFFRRGLKPVKSCQQGESFTLYENEVYWQNWRLRLGFNGREGLTLHWVSYEVDGKPQPLFYRLSISEMYIPYGDPRFPYKRDNFLDQGESGLGYRTASLNEGEHCIGNVKFLDAVLHNEAGEPVIFPRVVCIREEDAGIGWKHKDSVTRRQRLAITFMGTFSHHDYIYTWYLYQDATIQFNVQLTGALGVTLAAEGAEYAGHGTTVAPRLNAPYHQHFTLLRVDANIDGKANTVVMTDIIPGPGKTGSPLNFYGNGFTRNTTVLKTASEGRTNSNSESARTWVITPTQKVVPDEDGLSGFQLVPPASPRPMLQMDSAAIKVGGFIEFDTWVTPYNDDQLFGAGLFAGSVNNPDGLPQWVERDPNGCIVDTDIVLWHVVNCAHVPRTEDWPVINAEGPTLELRPYNYFKVNPALDVVQANESPVMCPYPTCKCPGPVKPPKYEYVEPYQPYEPEPYEDYEGYREPPSYDYNGYNEFEYN